MRSDLRGEFTIRLPDKNNNDGDDLAPDARPQSVAMIEATTGMYIGASGQDMAV
jgi:hypothetical protein